MTVLQPHKHLILINYVIGALIVAVFAGALSLVYGYNRLVDIEHGIADMKIGRQKIETESALLRDEIFGLTDESRFASLAAARALVKDASPQYLTLDPQWSLASR